MKKFIARFDNGRTIKSKSMRRLNSIVAKQLLNEDVNSVTFEAVELNARKIYNISEINLDGDNIAKRLHFAEQLANLGR